MKPTDIVKNNENDIITAHNGVATIADAMCNCAFHLP